MIDGENYRLAEAAARLTVSCWRDPERDEQTESTKRFICKASDRVRREDSDPEVKAGVVVLG
jgi:hypothetical protein